MMLACRVVVSFREKEMARALMQQERTTRGASHHHGPPDDLDLGKAACAVGPVVVLPDKVALVPSDRAMMSPCFNRTVAAVRLKHEDIILVRPCVPVCKFFCYWIHEACTFLCSYLE